MTNREILSPDLVQESDLIANLEMQRNSERDHVMFRLVQAGLEEVDKRYGPNGLRPQAYHNADHARDVIDAAIQMADAAISEGKITEAEKDLLILAACYHDIERDYASGVNEAASGRVISLLMKQSGQFTEQETVRVYKMIMGTEVYFVDGIMHQKADPNDLLSQILADADLASLGKSPTFYWDRAMRYVEELTNSTDPSPDEILGFALDQDSFLRHHEFYTDEAKILFPYKRDNIRFTQEMQHHYATLRSA